MTHNTDALRELLVRAKSIADELDEVSLERATILELSAALAAAQQGAQVPQGWKLVPVEPTDAMVDATHHGQPVDDIWRDMLSASPQAPAQPASTGGTMELVLIRGLPGSGKTTMARVLALVGYEHHEADHYFERDGAYRFDPAELPKAHAWCLERAMGSISRGARCVVANTFTRRWEMQPYLDAAKAAGVPVRVIEARGEWENCHGVPADAIERMRARWELVDA